MTYLLHHEEIEGILSAAPLFSAAVAWVVLWAGSFLAKLRKEARRD